MNIGIDAGDATTIFVTKRLKGSKNIIGNEAHTDIVKQSPK